MFLRRKYLLYSTEVLLDIYRGYVPEMQGYQWWIYRQDIERYKLNVNRFIVIPIYNWIKILLPYINFVNLDNNKCATGALCPERLIGIVNWHYYYEWLIIKNCKNTSNQGGVSVSCWATRNYHEYQGQAWYKMCMYILRISNGSGESFPSKREVPRDVRNTKVRKQDKFRRNWSRHLNTCKSQSWTGLGVRRSKRPLLACHTLCKCFMETAHN